MPDFSSHYVPLRITGQNLLNAARNPGPRETKLREITVKGKNSPKYSFGLREAKATAEYKMPWDVNGVNVFTAKRDFCGYSEAVFDNVAIVGINRTIPYPHPQDPNYLYADAVTNIEGDVPLGQDSNQVALYDEASVSVAFSNRNFVIGDSGIFDESELLQYVTISVQPTGRYERVPNPQFYRFYPSTNVSVVAQEPDGSLLAQGAGIPTEIVTNSLVITFCEAEVSIIWHQVPVEAIPWNAISTCVGRCDGDRDPKTFDYTFLRTSYLGPILQAASGRKRAVFLCLVPKISDPYPMVNGGFAVDINYRFKFYPFGANYFYNWKIGDYQAGGNSQTGKLFFQGAKFNTLFLGS